MSRKIFIGFCILLTVSILGLAGCYSSPTPRVQLANTGLFGEHELNRIENFGAVNGSMQGSFFLGIGSVSGTIGSELRLQFYWEPNPGEIVVSTLPYSKFRFVINDTKEVPTVEFIFDEDYMNAGRLSDFKDSDKANLNSWVMSDYVMKVAIIRISKATLEKEVYLPKVK